MLWKELRHPCVREKRRAVERRGGWGKGKTPCWGHWRECGEALKVRCETREVLGQLQGK